ncbi:MAG: hypothetical protein M3Q73_02200 [bacterium]|nr:hypothetical protein [bacterium]
MPHERLPDADAAWLRECWKKSGLRTPLTEEEWQRVIKMCEQYNLAVNLGCHSLGFELFFFNHPLTHGDKIEEIDSLSEDDLPWGWRGSKGMMRVAEALTHTDRNKKILAFYNFLPLQDPGYYSY